MANHLLLKKNDPTVLIMRNEVVCYEAFFHARTGN